MPLLLLKRGRIDEQGGALRALAGRGALVVVAVQPSLMRRPAQVGGGKVAKAGDRVALHYDCKLRNVRCVSSVRSARLSVAG